MTAMAWSLVLGLCLAAHGGGKGKDKPKATVILTKTVPSRILRTMEKADRIQEDIAEYKEADKDDKRAKQEAKEAKKELEELAKDLKGTIKKYTEEAHETAKESSAKLDRLYNEMEDLGDDKDRLNAIQKKIDEEKQTMAWAHNEISVYDLFLH